MTPERMARDKQEGLVMCGLHGRAKAIRSEMRARNARALLPDASGKVWRRGVIDGDAPFSRRMPMPAQALLEAAQRVQVPAVLSGDAGRYLCNYLCWRACEAVNAEGPRLAAFVHVPAVSRSPHRAGKSRWTSTRLLRVGQNVLKALVSAVNRS